jgi:ankyrin repeat protein
MHRHLLNFYEYGRTADLQKHLASGGKASDTLLLYFHKKYHCFKQSQDYTRLQELDPGGTVMSIPPLFFVLTKTKDVAQAKLLLESDATVMDFTIVVEGYPSMLDVAVKHADSVELVQFMVNAGAAVDNTSRSALYMACKHKKTELIQLLVHSQANVNWIRPNHAYCAPSPLLQAVRGGSPADVEFLYSKGADLCAGIGLHRTTILHYCVYGSHHKLARWALKTGAIDVDALNGMKKTALADCVMLKDCIMAKLLLEHGANPTMELENNTSTVTPVEMAVVENAGTVLCTMLKHLSDDDVSYAERQALCNGQADIVRLLFSRKEFTVTNNLAQLVLLCADRDTLEVMLDCVKSDISSAVHRYPFVVYRAVEDGKDVVFICKLIALGFNSTYVGTSKMTAEDYAVQKGDDTIVKLLQYAKTRRYSGCKFIGMVK